MVLTSAPESEVTSISFSRMGGVQPDKGIANPQSTISDPLLSEGVADRSAASSLSAGEGGSEWQGEERVPTGSTLSKRRLFGFGRQKKDDKPKKAESGPGSPAGVISANVFLTFL